MRALITHNALQKIVLTFIAVPATMFALSACDSDEVGTPFTTWEGPYFTEDPYPTEPDTIEPDPPSDPGSGYPDRSETDPCAFPGDPLCPRTPIEVPGPHLPSW